MIKNKDTNLGKGTMMNGTSAMEPSKPGVSNSWCHGGITGLSPPFSKLGMAMASA